MKSIRIASVIVGAIAAVTLANMSPVQAGDAFAFSFNTGDVAFAYSDGYWDRSHNWHGWRDAREHNEYRRYNGDAYRAARERDNGWRNENLEYQFSFDLGAVAFAYSDGYWDRSHKWHAWRNAREGREYARYNPRNVYSASRHTRERNMGWRGDEDRDGIPNRVDRDRDGAGVPNRADRAPDNRRRD